MQRVYGAESLRPRCDVPDHADRFRLRVFVAARLLARALRGSAGWKLLSRLCACREKRRFPDVSLLALAGRLPGVLLAPRGFNRRPGRDSHYAAILCSVGCCCSAPRGPTSTPIQNVALSRAALCVAGFIFVLVSRKDFLKEVHYVLVMLVGLAIYMWRAARLRQWPFTTGEHQ